MKDGWKFTIFTYQREREGGVSSVAAVEKIIPGMDLSFSNRNSYNYCGSI